MQCAINYNCFLTLNLYLKKYLLPRSFYSCRKQLNNLSFMNTILLNFYQILRKIEVKPSWNFTKLPLIFFLDRLSGVSKEVRSSLTEFTERVIEHPSLPLDIRSNAGIILVSSLSLQEIRDLLEKKEKGKEDEDCFAGSRYILVSADCGYLFLIPQGYFFWKFTPPPS